MIRKTQLLVSAFLLQNHALVLYLDNDAILNGVSHLVELLGTSLGRVLNEGVIRAVTARRRTGQFELKRRLLNDLWRRLFLWRHHRWWRIRFRIRIKNIALCNHIIIAGGAAGGPLRRSVAWTLFADRRLAQLA